MILFLMGCPLAMSEAPVYPVHEVRCNHLFTPYEANIKIDVYDNFEWDTIAVDLDQGSDDWSAQLRKQSEDHWSIEMNLMELDCNSEYDLGFYFLIYQE